jgi:hypothetical protein
MYGQSPTVSKNGNLEEVAELAYLILLDPADSYSSESPQLLANVGQHRTPYNIFIVCCIFAALRMPLLFVALYGKNHI